jgi:glycosyltransferase involved in cell wall biosynthesis
MTQGISIILCTHNGETRLRATLSHLRSQHSAGISWEVLLVDNASTDSTSKVALSSWGEAPVPLRITREAKLGLQCARERGLKEAKYDFIGFVDDDNWIASDWVRVAYETLESDASL